MQFLFLFFRTLLSVTHFAHSPFFMFVEWFFNLYFCGCPSVHPSVCPSLGLIMIMNYLAKQILLLNVFSRLWPGYLPSTYIVASSREVVQYYWCDFHLLVRENNLFAILCCFLRIVLWPICNSCCREL